MNRMNEFFDLQRELDREPEALRETTERCRERICRGKRSRFWKIPASAVAAALACFMILTNTSIAFARSVGGIPLLSDLAKAVTYEPGLRAAIDNQYVQPVALSQTKNGVTLSVPYLIADKSQLVLFYSLKSADGRNLSLESAGLDGLTDASGAELKYTSYSSGPSYLSGTLQEIHYQFQNGVETPAKIHLKLIALEGGAPGPDADGKAAASFSVDIPIDKSLFQEPEKFDLQKEYTVLGQKLTIQSAEIAPTMTRITMDTPDGNTALLRDISFSLTDEQGRVWNGRSNGITATFDASGDNVREVYLESNYFSHVKHLYLKIESVGWLPKSQRTVKVDVKNKTASLLSDSIRMTKLEQNGSHLVLTFEKPVDGQHISSIFSSIYSDSAGSWNMDSISDRNNENRMEEIFSVNHWKGETIYLTRDWAPPAVPVQPVVISLK